MVGDEQQAWGEVSSRELEIAVSDVQTPPARTRVAISHFPPVFYRVSSYFSVVVIGNLRTRTFLSATVTMVPCRTGCSTVGQN